ncbi:hypothetical protein, partial [Methylicorpusculum sp.]
FSLKFDTSLFACEDYDFWFRIAQTSGAPGIVKSCWVYYRQHANSMSRSYMNQYRHDAELCKRVFASANTNMPWIDSPHERTDYFFAMLAASLVTAIRLWSFDRDSFNAFMQEHVLFLHHKLKEGPPILTTNSTILCYMSRARLTIMKMRYRDNSIDKSVYDSFISIFPPNSIYLSLAIKKGIQSTSIKTIARIAKFDLQIAWFRLRNKTTKHPPAKAGGFE